jgi:hypothetical protein
MNDPTTNLLGAVFSPEQKKLSARYSLTHCLLQGIQKLMASD